MSRCDLEYSSVVFDQNSLNCRESLSEVDFCFEEVLICQRMVGYWHHVIPAISPR